MGNGSVLLSLSVHSKRRTMLHKSVTHSFGASISKWTAAHLTDTVVRRSKRMILDTLGVGVLGTRTQVFQMALQYSQKYKAQDSSRVWGSPGLTLPAELTAFVNGVAVHSMDFDDTWHPATHPSGAVLPGLLALAETLPTRPSGLDLLLAFNAGIEVQGRLMRFSKEAFHIPKRFHPPAVVGVMGSAAAAAKLLGLSAAKSVEALAIAVSYAGAPIANAATQTKPLHIGNAARRGLEASQLALLGLEGNKHILDLDSGFGVFYADYSPIQLSGDTHSTQFRWILEDQDVAFKRFPAHLGMHWVADASAAVREKMLRDRPDFDFSQVRRIVLRVPGSRYVDRQSPVTEHEARHSFQFNACSALLDGCVTSDTFTSRQMERKALKDLLLTVQLETPKDNLSSFDKMYCEVDVLTDDGGDYTARCDTFYGHWRKPLSQEDLVNKFKANASTVLPLEPTESIISIVDNLEQVPDCTVLGTFLQMNHESQHLVLARHH